MEESFTDNSLIEINTDNLDCGGAYAGNEIVIESATAATTFPYNNQELLSTQNLSSADTTTYTMMGSMDTMQMNCNFNGIPWRELAGPAPEPMSTMYMGVSGEELSTSLANHIEIVLEADLITAHDLTGLQAMEPTFRAAIASMRLYDAVAAADRDDDIMRQYADYILECLGRYRVPRLPNFQCTFSTDENEEHKKMRLEWNTPHRKSWLFVPMGIEYTYHFPKFKKKKKEKKEKKEITVSADGNGWTISNGSTASGTEVVDSVFRFPDLSGSELRDVLVADIEVYLHSLIELWPEAPNEVIKTVVASTVNELRSLMVSDNDARTNHNNVREQINGFFSGGMFQSVAMFDPYDPEFDVEAEIVDQIYDVPFNLFPEITDRNALINAVADSASDSLCVVSTLTASTPAYEIVKSEMVANIVDLRSQIGMEESSLESIRRYAKYMINCITKVFNASPATLEHHIRRLNEVVIPTFDDGSDDDYDDWYANQIRLVEEVRVEIKKMLDASKKKHHKDRVYMDAGPALEIGSPIHRTWKDMQWFYRQMSKHVNPRKFKPSDIKKGGGGGHITVSIPPGDELFKAEFMLNMSIDAANRPYLNWVFNDPSDNHTASCHWSDVGFNRMYRMSVESGDGTLEWKEVAGAIDFRGHAIRKKNESCFEFRIFDMVRNERDLKDHIKFVDAYLRWIHRVTKAGLAMRKDVRINNARGKTKNKWCSDQLQFEGVFRDVKKEFKDFLQELGLDYRDYRRFVERNLEVRMCKPYGKKYLV